MNTPWHPARPNNAPPDNARPSGSLGLNRRTFLTATATGLGGLALAACSGGNTPTRIPAGTTTTPAVSAAAIKRAEARRPHTGRTRAYRLTPGSTQVDLGGPTVTTLAYGDTIPGRVIRADVGDELAVAVTNRMDRPTSVHWHGIALRNDMDGAAPATPDIDPGASFTYRFSVPDPGTYWAHPHVGLDTDFGLYLPVIVDDPNEPADYDTEWVVVLDDWTDGIGPSPKQIYTKLTSGGMSGMDHGDMNGMDGMEGMEGMDHGAGSTPTDGMSGMSGMSGMGAMGTADPSPTGSAGMGMGGMRKSTLLGGDAGDVAYPYYLANGRIPSAPTTFRARPGQRIRIRIINAGADTAFRVALAGHRMTVTHTDGFPVEPTEVDALLLGMGERYDVIVTAGDGVFPLVAAAEGKGTKSLARALLRTATGTTPGANVRPRELSGRVGTVEVFTATQPVTLPTAKPDVELAANLGGNMASYRWTINGRTFDQLEPLTIRQGQRARLTFANHTMMWHPMHLHGHTFQVNQPGGRPGPRKDTVIVLPMRSVSVDLVADNPGDWMLHCHNGYHMDAGMMTRLDYRA
ncbi:multicopper oxidase family protein [Segeticoccus rhizosphaerae]|uniref:multicopper oxidase family protein n=1 Tax=Segeticoccus rhizosphaerae TaxID=1104777 RepID=UPI0010C00405|nr:multicopper oxidase family protein [Ornithinicoccus soli]